MLPGGNRIEAIAFVEGMRRTDVDEIDVGIVITFGIRAVDCRRKVGDDFLDEGLPFGERGTPDGLDYVVCLCVGARDDKVFEERGGYPTCAYDSPAKGWEIGHGDRIAM